MVQSISLMSSEHKSNSPLILHFCFIFHSWWHTETFSFHAHGKQMRMNITSNPKFKSSLTIQSLKPISTINIKLTVTQQYCVLLWSNTEIQNPTLLAIWAYNQHYIQAANFDGLIDRKLINKRWNKHKSTFTSTTHMHTLGHTQETIKLEWQAQEHNKLKHTQTYTHRNKKMVE